MIHAVETQAEPFETMASCPPLGGVAKRALDIFIAVSALVFLAPLMLATALTVKLADGGPIFFKHQRIGLGGKSFPCIKFRSMRVDAKQLLADLLASSPEARAEWAENHKLKDDPRLTPIGEFLRKSSLDELPQFINILRGEMSIVGPRPIVAEEIVRYQDDFTHYVRTRPGLTGLWQVSGRSEIDYAERVRLDTSYVSTWRIDRDISLIFRTIPAVMMRRGSY